MLKRRARRELDPAAIGMVPGDQFRDAILAAIEVEDGSTPHPDDLLDAIGINWHDLSVMAMDVARPLAMGHADRADARPAYAAAMTALPLGFLRGLLVAHYKREWEQHGR